MPLNAATSPSSAPYRLGRAIRSHMQSHLGPSTLIALALISSALVYRHEAILDREIKQCSMYLGVQGNDEGVLVMATEHPTEGTSSYARDARGMAREAEKFFHLREDGNHFCDLLPPPSTQH